MIEKITLINTILMPFIIVICKYIGVESKFKEFGDNIN